MPIILKKYNEIEAHFVLGASHIQLHVNIIFTSSIVIEKTSWLVWVFIFNLSHIIFLWMTFRNLVFPHFVQESNMVDA